MKPRLLLSCMLISIVSTATARPWWLGPFDRDGCLTQVTSMLTSGNISMISNSSLFFHDSNGLLLSSDTASPILTPSGCEQLCSAHAKPPKNSVPRLITWLLPIMLLIANVYYGPIRRRTYLAVFLLIGDPINSMLSLLSILQGWNQCFTIPSEPQRSNPEQAKREKSMAAILLSLGDCLSLAGNTDISQNIYDKWLASSKLSPPQLDALIHQTAARLAECRTSEMLQAFLALFLYFFQVLVLAIDDSAGPSDEMTSPIMLLSWLLPMVLLSNAIGRYGSWKIRWQILSKFLKRVREHTWYDQLPVLERSTLAYSGGILLYQPGKFRPTRARTPILLFLLSILPVLIAFATAFAVLYTPPTYLTCRHFLVVFIVLLWLLNALVTWTVIKFSSLTPELRWYTILVKDAMIFCIILALLIGTSYGLFTSCWCLSGRWRYGVAQARVYLNPAAQFARNSGASYPITVGICFGAQFGIWFGMMSFGRKGFGVWRWSEEEKDDALGQGASLDTDEHQQPSLNQLQVDSGDTEGWTPLFEAATKGPEAVVRLLVEKGADVNSKNKGGRTPLPWAAENGHEAVVKLLVEKGADVDSKDTEGRTPLSWADISEETGQPVGPQPGNDTKDRGLFHFLQECKVRTTQCIRRITRPPIPKGYRRIEWICDCGEIKYGDFDNSNPAALSQLQSELQRLGCHSRTPDPQRQQPGDLALGDRDQYSQITVPQSVEEGCNSTGSAASRPGNESVLFNSGTSEPIRPTNNENHEQPKDSSSSQRTLARPCKPLSALTKPRYFELCVNTGEHTISLGEIDITNVQSDGMLFQKIWRKYRDIRGHGIRRFFVKPNDIHFVHFGIKQRHQVGIYGQPMDIPPEIEVEKERYHYYKCPLETPPPMPSHVFLHYMNCARTDQIQNSLGAPVIHKDAYFLNRLPKKVGCSIFLDSQSDQLFGWGVRILEGPNKVALSWMLVAGILISFITAVVYDVVGKTTEQGFAIGQWMMAVIASVMAALYFQWEAC